VQTFQFLLKQGKNYAQFAGGNTYIYDYFNNINAATLVINITNIFKVAVVILVTIVANELAVYNITIYNTCPYLMYIGPCIIVTVEE